MSFIVSEISKNWIDGKSQSVLLLSQQFEEIINFNLKRGYALHSFQINRLFVEPDHINETIIAVFEERK